MKRRNFISNLKVGAASITGFPLLIHPAIKEKSSKIIDVRDVLKYINTNWGKSIVKDEPGKGFGGLDLPYPYTTPSIKGEGQFSIFFYWDTYFTNMGLLRNGWEEQAKNNIRNIL